MENNIWHIGDLFLRRSKNESYEYVAKQCQLVACHAYPVSCAKEKLCCNGLKLIEETLWNYGNIQ